MLDGFRALSAFNDLRVKPKAITDKNRYIRSLYGDNCCHGKQKGRPQAPFGGGFTLPIYCCAPSGYWTKVPFV